MSPPLQAGSFIAAWAKREARLKNHTEVIKTNFTESLKKEDEMCYFPLK